MSAPNTGGEGGAAAPFFDLSKLQGIIDPTQYFERLQGMVRGSLQNGDALPTSVGVTKPASFEPSLSKFFQDTFTAVKQHKGPTSFDDEPGQYREERFNFIAANEGHSRRLYKDHRGIRTIGYGFNLDDKSNKNVFMKALGVDEAYFNEVRNGQRDLSDAQTRTLFEASVNNAETFLNNKLGKLALSKHQRLALVSLAYNNPSLIGPKLTRALKANDLKAADYEIRHNSNRGKHKGIQNRRTFEANMFAGVDTDIAKFASDKDYEPKMAAHIVKGAVGVSSDHAAIFTNPKGNKEVLANMSEEDRDLLDKATQFLPDNVRSITQFAIDKLSNKVTSLFSDDKPETRILTQEHLSPQTVANARMLAIHALNRGEKSFSYTDYDSVFGARENGLYISQLVKDKRGVSNLLKDGRIATADVGKGSEHYSGVMGVANMISDSVNDSVYVTATTIGGASLHRDDKGNVWLNDPYNFGGFKGNRTDSYSILRSAAGWLDDGQAAPFTYQINLGKIEGVNIAHLPLLKPQKKQANPRTDRKAPPSTEATPDFGIMP